jgi:alkaline phosphatase
MEQKTDDMGKNIIYLIEDGMSTRISSPKIDIDSSRS